MTAPIVHVQPSLHFPFWSNLCRNLLNAHPVHTITMMIILYWLNVPPPPHCIHSPVLHLLNAHPVHTIPSPILTKCPLFSYNPHDHYPILINAHPILAIPIIIILHWLNGHPVYTIPMILINILTKCSPCSYNPHDPYLYWLNGHPVYTIPMILIYID